jgi:hypothetical protein
MSAKVAVLWQLANTVGMVIPNVGDKSCCSCNRQPMPDTHSFNSNILKLLFLHKFNFGNNKATFINLFQTKLRK